MAFGVVRRKKLREKNFTSFHGIFNRIVTASKVFRKGEIAFSRGSCAPEMEPSRDDRGDLSFPRRKMAKVT